MKKLITIALLCASAILASADPIITTTITFTNLAGTTNGQTITINGATRTWTNNAIFPQTQIPIATNEVMSASNLFFTIARYPVQSVRCSWPGATNIVQLQSYAGFPLTVTASTNWASVFYSTNGTSTNATVVRVPKQIYGPIDTTNIVNGLIDFLNDNSATLTISPTAPAFVNFVQIGAVISAFQSGSNYTTFFALTQYTNAVNWSFSASNTLAALIASYNLNTLGTAAFTDISAYQPACSTLSNLCGFNLNGLSYLDGSENIVLIQTNTLSVSPGITRLEADSEGGFYLRYEDGNDFLIADTTHDVYFEDHAGNTRLELFDSTADLGMDQLKSVAGGTGLILTGQSGMLDNWKPIAFNNDPVTGSGSPSWPAVCAGTTTNFISAANNSGTSATTVNLFNVPANTLTNDGDTVTRTIGVQLASGTSSKRTEVYFAGTQIFDTGAIGNTTSGSLSIRCEVTRIDSATVAYSCSGIEQDASATPRSFAKVGTIGGLDFTTTQNFYEILTASGTGAASSQATVILDNTVLKPSSIWAALQ